MKWQQKLTKKELAHVKECCCGTLKGFRECRKFQKEGKERHTDTFEPCWECRGIAKKLGLEV